MKPKSATPPVISIAFGSSGVVFKRPETVALHRAYGYYLTLAHITQRIGYQKKADNFIMTLKEAKWLIVDDHAMFVDALSMTLSMLRPTLSIDVATSAQMALEQIINHSYDMVILDLQMPDMPCVELYQKLKQLGASNTLICSAIFQPKKADTLRKLGVQGYITKESEAVDILSFSDRIAAGETWVCTPKYAKQLARFEHSKTLLTERQVSILGLLDQGASTKQVAEHLHLSENTIKTHVRLMYDKLNASNRAECISKAKKLNLL